MASPRWSRSGWRRSSSGSSVAMTGAGPMAGRVRPGMGLRRPTGGSPATTSTSGTSISARGSSSCAATFLGRPRCGSTATSGPNSRPAGTASASASWPTGSRPATTPSGYSCCATGSVPRNCRRSSTAGWPTFRPRLAPPTGPAGTGGSCRCARSRSPARWCWTSHAAPGRSLRCWWPTTSASAGLTRSHSSSTGASTPTPTPALPPAWSPAAWT
jgi:hypothetical protein